jgi:hypothetical protein
VTPPVHAQSPGLLHRTWAPAAVGAAGLAAVTALAVRDPHVPGAWGSCVFFEGTGLWCPGCGGLRAVNDLTSLDLAGALSSNAVAVGLVALLALWWGVWSWASLAGRTLPWDRWVTPARVYLGLGVVLAFSVLRNLPGFEALGP